MRAIPRRRAASNTLTVPTTFTLAPATGAALQKGTCRAARWITAQGRTVSKTWTTVLLSEMSPVRHAIFSRSLSAIKRRGRRLSSDKSSAQAGTPARTSSARTQLPMQPPAPVTRTGPGKLARSIEKRSFIRIPLTATVGAANLPSPPEIFPKTRRPGKSSTRMASVTLSAVRKSFGSTEVVHGVDIGVEDGEFCVLVGPSGCGKSTLLRMIAGLEEISGGRIAIGERVVNGVAPKERDIAMVFQNYALYPHMSVYDNMAFSLKLAGESREETRVRVEEAAMILGLMEYLRRYPRQLSGGQRQRVAMGRAIVRKPEVFLFDEPLSNLDAKLRVAMRTEIKALHQRLKTTSLYVTPANQFVAGFIGSPAMNFVPGKVNAGGISVGAGIELPNPTRNLEPGRDVLLGVRPEHLAVDPSGVPVEVVVVEPTGADTQIFCKLAGTDVTAVVRERHAFRPGEE